VTGKKAKVKKLKVLKVEKIADNEHRIAVEFDTDAPLPIDPLPRDPIEITEDPPKSTWATWFKSFWTETPPPLQQTHRAVVDEKKMLEPPLPPFSVQHTQLHHTYEKKKNY